MVNNLDKKEFLNCGLLEVKVFDDNEKDYYVFEGYASTFGNVDRGGDVVVKGAFKEAIEELSKNSKPISGTTYSKFMPVLWQHNWNEPIGSFVEIREDEKGLFVKGILPKDDEFVKGRVIPQMKAGSISDMSIGYIVKYENYKDNVRYIEKVMLFETSLVTIPMNEQANITSMKTAVYQDLPIADKSIEFDYDEVKVRYEENGIEEKAYLIINKKDGANECLLPIADFIDSKLVAIPKALFHAAFEINKGDVTKGMIERDVDELKNNVNKYYKAMGLESPFSDKKAFRLDDEKSLSERELETLLKSGVSFSQKTAKVIVNALKEVSHRDDELKSQRDAVLEVKLNELLKTLTKT